MDKVTSQARILVLAVHYRSSGALLEMLNFARWLNDNENVGLTVVDNASGPEELTSIRRAIAEFRNAQLLESATNRGYFGAARFALDHYLGQGRNLPDWVIVCNHDIQIEDKEFFSKLLCQDPRAAGVIAPRIQVLPGEMDQNPFMRRRPGALRWANLRFVSSNYWAAAIWDWLSRRKSEFRSWVAARCGQSRQDVNAKNEAIYAAHGSFFIFSRRYFEAGGSLDGNLFLYGEEISVAEICRSLGLPVVYAPSLCVFHKEHQSTGKILSRFTYECQKKAMQYVTWRYLSRSPKPVGSCPPNLS
jgi:GT2 family glycosyltransferase